MIAYINVMSAISTSDEGAERMFHQLIEGSRNQFAVSNDGYKYITGHFILKSFMKLCDVLIKFSGKNKLGLEKEDMDGFVAYMKMLGQVVPLKPVDQTFLLQCFVSCWST